MIVKARGCADGRSQREYTTKSDTRSPTVSFEAMMMSCAIEEKENRYMAVATFQAPSYMLTWRRKYTCYLKEKQLN